MKKFVHLNAKTVAEASSMLAANKNSAVIAGGTDLLGVIKSDIIPDFPSAVVNIKTIPNLDYIKVDAGVLKIGTLATLDVIANSATVQGSWPALSTAAARVSSSILRIMGTIGGNICQKSRCWYYRYPQDIGGRMLCFRKGGPICFAVPGNNMWHSILAGQVCFSPFPGDTECNLRDQ